MFKHLEEIDYKLYERYLTLEKNIKKYQNTSQIYRTFILRL